jgi:hypothetical protein
VSDTHKHYLHDLGAELRERALKAKQQAKTARGTSDEQYEQGKAIAYYEVLSLMESEAKTFELPPEDLHFEGFDADRDLMGLG